MIKEEIACSTPGPKQNSLRYQTDAQGNPALFALTSFDISRRKNLLGVFFLTDTLRIIAATEQPIYDIVVVS